MRQRGTPVMVCLLDTALKMEAQLVCSQTSHRMRRCEHIVQQRRQPRPAIFGPQRPPSITISRSDSAALLKVSRVLPTNLIVPVRLGPPTRPRDVENADFSPMSRTQNLRMRNRTIASPQRAKPPRRDTHFFLINYQPYLKGRARKASLVFVRSFAK